MKHLNSGVAVVVAVIAAFIAMFAMARAQDTDVQVIQGYRVVASAPSYGRFPGELIIVMTDGGDPELQMWNQNDAAWEDIGGDGANLVFNNLTAAGTLDVTGASTLLGNYSRDYFYEDFRVPCGGIQNDGTAKTNGDNEENDWFCPSGFSFVQRNEGVATLNMVEPVSGGGIQVSGDVTANEGLQIKWVPHELMGWSESGEIIFFFEMSITIADISAFSGEWAMGIQRAAIFDADPDHTDINTWHAFTLSDDAGDLDVECELNAGEPGNDDTGTTWADTETYVLRIEHQTDGSSKYFVDGTEVTATNCNASTTYDWDAGDEIQPFYGHSQGSEGAATGVVINYVAMGEV